MRLGEIIQLEIPSDAEYVSLARQAVITVARCLRFNASEIEEMTMAMGEAFTNAVRYSYGSKKVTIRCEILNDGLAVAVKNAVREYELPELPVEPDLTRDGGLGLFIMDSLMDEVDLCEAPGYVTVRMKKRTKSYPGPAWECLPA